MAAFSTLAMIGLTAAGTTMSYVGQRKQARAVERAGRYNAEVAGMQADDALARGQEGAGQLARDTRSLIGTQQAVLAASGVDLTTGTAKQLTDESQVMGEF